MFYRLPTLSWSDILDENKLPSIGNGHLATTVLTPSIYIDGLYNGRAGKSFLLLISYLVQYRLKYSILSLGASHRARIQAIFAADFDIDGCSAEQMDRTYRMETSRGWILEYIQVVPTSLGYPKCNVLKLSKASEQSELRLQYIDPIKRGRF